MRLLLLGFFLLSSGFAQTSVIFNNAAAPTWGLAPGSMVSVNIVTNPFTRPDLSTLKIEIRPEGSAAVYTAQPVATTANTILAVLPSDLPLGVANVSVSVGGSVVDGVVKTIQVIPAAPGIFSAITPVAPGILSGGGSGIGPALAQHIDATGTPLLNQLTSPALPGQYITLWGTGLGGLTTPDVTVEIAGTLVKPSYAGHAPGQPGIDQINFLLPESTPDGCYVPLTVRAGGMVSNEVTIAKAASAGSCPHPLGLTAAEEATLDQGGSIVVDSSSIDSSVSQSITAASASASFTRGEGLMSQTISRGAQSMFLLTQPQEPDSRYLGCRLLNGGGVYGFIAVSPYDSGPSLTVTGPAGQQKQADAVLSGIYQLVFNDNTVTAPTPEQLPAPFFTAGPWQIAFPGGADIRPFLETITLPPPVAWTNRDALQRIVRKQDTAITWSPDGYSDSDVMTATLSIAGAFIPMPAGATALAMSCRAPARDGRLVLPAELMSQLPKPLMVGPGSAQLTLLVQPRPSARHQFPVPLVKGGSISGISTYTRSETARVAVE